MKVFIPITLAVAAAALAWTPSGPTEEAAIAGRYLEVRSASVMGGAVQINGELDQGRRAILGWAIEEGSWQGISLAGVRLVASIASDEPLSRDQPRRSVVYVDALDEAQREAALAWVREARGSGLGRVISVERADVELAFEGDDYRLVIPGSMHVEGAALADRSCCSMPSSVRVEPIGAGPGCVVGKSRICRFGGGEGVKAWSYAGANNAFVGMFRSALRPPPLEAF